MFTLYSPEKPGTIHLSPNAETCVLLAAQDLQKNLRALSGADAGFAFDCTATQPTISIQTDPTDAPAYPEGYRIQVMPQGVRITGADALGTVYGIYTFAQKCLGIEPLYHFTDVFPEQTDSLTLSCITITSTEKPCRYRGWFVNDEDFLSGYAPSGAKRKINYNMPFFEEVLSVEMMDIIYESALRLGMNTIIPCSYLDILNPAEEAIVAQAVKRGLYVSQHHQEPVGVAHFAAENYMNAHFPGKAVSFRENPEEMQEIWRVYIEKWAVYEPQVIWQLGLRGKGDVAVWSTDGSVGNSSEIRGRIISDAISAQYRMIAEKLGHTNFLSTTTLWLEGAALYQQGVLQIPADTITVFSDIGDTQLLSDDFYHVQRKENCRYGIYYHAGYYAEGPHYADGTDPNKMLFCYREAEKYNSFYFSILNVGNIRELTTTIRLNGAIVASSPREFDLNTYYKTAYPIIYGDAADTVAQLDQLYFAAFGDLGEELGHQIVDCGNFHYHSYPGDLPFPRYPLTDGCLARFGSFFAGYRVRSKMKPFMENEEMYRHLQQVLAQSVEPFEKVAALTKEKEHLIPKKALNYYRFSQIYRAQVMLQNTRCALHLSHLCKYEDMEAHRAIALDALTSLYTQMKSFATGKWEGWYDCMERLSIEARLEYTRLFPHSEMDA